MQQIVSITNRGQLTIPKAMLEKFGITNGAKAVVRRSGSQIIVEPKRDFWSLAGSLASSVKLTDKQLRQARDAFAKQWGNHD